MPNLTAGLDLLVVGYLGTYGTDRLLSEKPEEIRKRFGRAYLMEEIIHLMGLPLLSFDGTGVNATHINMFSDSQRPVPLYEEDLQAKKNAGEIMLGDADDILPDFYNRYSVCKIKEVGKGGFLAALWDFLEEESRDEEGRKIGKAIGCEFRYDRLPFLSITLELSELFDLNPYRLYSDNAFLIASGKGAQLRDAFRAVGIQAEIIGRTTEEKQRVRVDGKEQSFLQKSHRDELEKVLSFS